jgi:hypothetical protein
MGLQFLSVVQPAPLRLDRLAASQEAAILFLTVEQSPRTLKHSLFAFRAQPVENL